MNSYKAFNIDYTFILSFCTSVTYIVISLDDTKLPALPKYHCCVNLPIQASNDSLSNEEQLSFIAIRAIKYDYRSRQR